MWDFMKAYFEQFYDSCDVLIDVLAVFLPWIITGSLIGVLAAFFIGLTWLVGGFLLDLIKVVIEVNKEVFAEMSAESANKEVEP